MGVVSGARVVRLVLRWRGNLQALAGLIFDQREPGRGRFEENVRNLRPRTQLHRDASRGGERSVSGIAITGLRRGSRASPVIGRAGDALHSLAADFHTGDIQYTYCTHRSMHLPSLNCGTHPRLSAW